MNNNIVPFNNAALGCSIRTVIINEEPWFVAKDVCDALEIGRHQDSTRYLDDD
ncbi:BRO-N domain-containing protein, partial [Akkermansia muciniphila]